MRDEYLKLISKIDQLEGEIASLRGLLREVVLEIITTERILLELMRRHLLEYVKEVRKLQEEIIRDPELRSYYAEKPERMEKLVKFMSGEERSRELLKEIEIKAMEIEEALRRLERGE